MVDTIELDYETYSENDIKLGPDVYFDGAEMLMGAYSINGSAWRQFESHIEESPAEMIEALEDPEVEKWAFNATFERVASRRLLGIRTPIKGWRCTMVLASMLSFTGSLGDIGKQMGLAQEKQKMTIGKRLIDLFCSPQKVTKNHPHRRRDWTTDPEEWEQFKDYNVQDCVAERAMREKFLKYPHNPFEWEVYEADQAINDRGLPVALEFCEGAIQLSAARKAMLLEQMRGITGLANPASGAQLLPWLRDRGYYFNDLQKESVQKVLTVDKEQFKRHRGDEFKDLNEEDFEQVWLDSRGQFYHNPL